MSNVIAWRNANGNTGNGLSDDVLVQALRQTGQGVIIVDEHRTIRFCNPASQALLAFRGEMAGYNVTIMFSAEDWQVCEQYIATQLHHGVQGMLGASFSQKVDLMRGDGSRLPVNLAIAKIISDNKIYFSLIIDDLSERKRLEEELRLKNEQLDKLNSQVEKFLYSTSHDLRSPITSCMGLINLMRLETKDAMLLDYISKLEGCTEKLDKIIRDIMNFSKTTYQQRKSVSIDFEQMIATAMRCYGVDSGYSHIHFEAVIDQVRAFYSDDERLGIILENIIQNAILFFDPQKVRPFVRITVKVSREEAIIEIMDNGIGIAKQHHAQIFNMFYKATYQSRGVGMGLYIVRESISQLKGSIFLESELGFGTLIRLHIPNDAAVNRHA